MSNILPKITFGGVPAQRYKILIFHELLFIEILINVHLTGYKRISHSKKVKLILKEESAYLVLLILRRFVENTG